MKSTRRSYTWILPTLLALIVSACGGGGGGGGGGAGDGASQGDYIPMANGDRWVYRDDGSQVMQQQVSATRTLAGQLTVDITETRQIDGHAFVTTYARTSTGLTELPDASDAVSVAIGPQLVLQLPVAAGQSFVQVDKSLPQGFDLDSDGRPDAMSVRSVVTVLGFGSMTVPAGTFANNAHVQTVVTVSGTSSSTGAVLNVVTTANEWYAPGVGLLRQDLDTAVGTRHVTTTRELLAYNVGGRKSDASAPVLVDKLPAAGSVQSSLFQLLLNFDRAMDAVTLRNGGLTLSGPAGQTLPYTLSQGDGPDQVLVFVASGLPNGTTTVRLGAAARDLIGNPMSPVEWGVQVDSSGPVVLSSQPVLGAGDQPLNTTVTLHFNEPLAPASVNASTIRLFDALGNTVPASVSMPDSSSVLVTPVQPLARAGRYFVQLTQGVADLQGNFVLESAFVADFFTVQGNLSAPAKLAGATGRGLAKGDFNGDGRVDLLTIADGVAPDVSSFNIFLQNASGGFDAPLRRDTPARSDCVDTAGFVQAGDIDGDGRVDIISTRGTCGVEVAYQGSDGQFSRTVLLGAAGAFALADLDGDGRLDVVGSAFAGEQVSLWRQQADGSWIAEQVPLFTNGFGTLAVGDLNGDGRPDLVLTSGQGDLTRTLGVSYQQPDGSFGVPQYRSDGVFNRAATIGDLDGDGRLDLLLATPDAQGLRWFRQQADGSLAEPVVIAGFGDAEQLQVADLDGDGRADIVFGLNGFAPFVGVHWQGMGGSFSAPQNFRAGLPPVSLSLVVADLNGDGRLDVGLTGPVLLLNNGSPVTPASAGQAAANPAVTLSRKTQAWRQAIQQIKPLRLTR